MFKIINVTSQFEPAPRVEPQFSFLVQFNSQNLRLSVLSRLFVLESVWNEEIGEHLGWGKNTQQNKVEQGGILLGEVFYDPYQAKIFGIVQKAIAGTSAHGSPGYLSMGHHTWEEMLKEADAFLERTEHPLRIIGWYHSHPNELPVFMSGTDLNTQEKFFNNDWQFSMVINPHKQIWRAFVGRNAFECEGVVIADQSFLVWKDWSLEIKDSLLDSNTSTTEMSIDFDPIAKTTKTDNNSTTESMTFSNE